jgi:hypothetical protein
MSDAPGRPRCPFYGFHWPENSHALNDTKGAECGLDFEKNRPCLMEEQGRPPDYDCCPVVERLRTVLEACKKNIKFHPAEGPEQGVPMDEWKKRVMLKRRSAG